MLRTIRVLALLTFSIVALYYARSFLIPLAFAGLLAMLMMPLSKWMEGKGVSQGIASLLCTVLLIIIISGMIVLLVWQLKDLIGNFQKLEQLVNTAMDKVQTVVERMFGIPPHKQQEIIQEQAPQGATASVATTMISTIAGLLIDVVLTIVYIFLFLYFRQHIKAFIYRITPPDERSKGRKIMTDASNVAQQYITGLATMIVILWIMYGIGFSLVGVENAIFFAILCGLLEVVPFVGNITGSTITVLMVIAQGGTTGMVIGVIAVYAFIQFIQTYILEPMVVGAEVNINPLFTIMVLVLGELLWGIAGMILAIPLLGILKIIFDHVEPLKPYGFLIGENKQITTGFLDKIRSLWRKRSS